VDGYTSVMGEKVLILLAIYMFKNTSRSVHLALKAYFGNKVHFYAVSLSVTGFNVLLTVHCDIST
jgi:hypothetical protein